MLCVVVLCAQAIAARKQQPISDESPLELEFFRGDAHAVPDEEMDEEELEEEDDEEEEEDEEGRTPHRKPASFTVVPPKQQTKREQGPNNGE